MTFLNDNFARITSSANENAQVWWAYNGNTNGITDNIATIVASGYFNDKINTLAVTHVISIEATDGHRLVRVTSVTANVTVETYDTHEGSLDLTQGSMYIGDASNKATSIDVKTDTQILVGNGTTATSVATSGDTTMTNAGVVTIANDAITTAKILASNVTEAKIAPNTLTGTITKDVADANVIGGLPVLFRINTAGGATANTDVTMTHKVRVIDAWVVNNAAGTASDTIQVLNTAAAITAAIDISGGDKTLARCVEIDDAAHEIAAAGTLRITETDGGGSDSPATTVYVLAIRVA